MAEDRRPQGERRVGDATQARIDDMATGWKQPEDGADGDDGADAEKAGPKLASPKPTPAKAPTKPPPLPRPKPTSAPPSPPKARRPPVPRAATPTVESGPAHVRTIKRSSVTGRTGAAASAPEPAESSSVRVSPKASLIRAEGSPLPVRRPITSPPHRAADATVIPTGDEVMPAELRAPAALQRQSGLWGDMRYVGTVILGRRALGLELKETGLEIEAEKRSRDKELTEFARLAVSDPNVTDPVVDQAREKLVELEELRSRKAGAAAAAEQAIDSILRERDKVKDEREQDVSKMEAEIAAIEAKLAPLEKRRVEIGKRAREAVEQLERYDKRIAAETDALKEVSAPDAAAGEATLAGLRAEREVADRRQPVLASELAEVEPVIRNLKTEKGELTKHASKLRRAEDESVVRSSEKITAARAHKLVVDRAAADRTREQNELLRDLGEDLYRQPPAAVAHLASPIEDRAETLERLKNRATVAREKLESIEHRPLARGIILWLLVAGAVAALALLLTGKL